MYSCHLDIMPDTDSLPIFISLGVCSCDTTGPSIGLQELDAAIQLLTDKRQQVATHESSSKLQLLMLFLQHAK